MYRPSEELLVSEFQLDAIPPGTKKRVQLLVDTLPDGQPLAFQTLIVRGKRPGKKLLVTGCVHGDEYEGPIAIQDLYEELDPDALNGTFFAIPILNTPAFVAATREGGWDHQNLARIFPGSATGTLSERIANAFSEYVVGQADFFVDMHAAGNLYTIRRFAGYGVLAPEVNELQRAAAIAFGFDVVWGTTLLPGRSLAAAADKGVPAMYVEMTGEGRCRSEDRALAVQGLRNVMALLDLVPGDFPRMAPRYCFETTGDEAGHLQVDNPSPTSGLYVPAVEVWSPVEKGQKLGEVRHPDGTVLAEIRSPRAGRVLFQRSVPRVFSGDFLAYVLELPDGIS